MENGNIAPQVTVLDRLGSLAPGLQDRWPKPTLWLGAELVGALCLGLMAGKALFSGFGASPAKLDLGEGRWVRSSAGAFELFLPKGWEDFTAEANVGIPAENQRDIVFRQKNSSGNRLLVLRRTNAQKPGEEKTQAFLASWMQVQRREMARLRQQVGAGAPAAEPPAIPALSFQLIRPAGGEQIVTGAVAFKGAFYDFSYATPFAGDSELLLGLLGSMRQAQGAPSVPHKAAPKPAVTKPAANGAAKKGGVKAKKK